MTYTERALQLRPVIEKASQSLEDSVALTAVELFPKWKELVEEEQEDGTQGREVDKGFRFQYEGKLYRTEQPRYKFVKHYIPGSVGTESLFSVVNETHKGTKDDPIPYQINMEIYQGLYYTQNGVLYQCTRDSGQPLHHDLALLVGAYVVVVDG
jgi:hypothetical protein